MERGGMAEDEYPPQRKASMAAEQRGMHLSRLHDSALRNRARDRRRERVHRGDDGFSINSQMRLAGYSAWPCSAMQARYA